jgi:anaerobic ribonucleoside-triphosphate reductase activating protein
MLIELAARVPCTAVEGPHLRYALWVQGCTLRCAGCCNPEMFSRGGGQTIEVARVCDEIDRSRRDHGIDGITVLGGEPLEQLAAVTALARAAAARGLGVIVFTGYGLTEAQALPAWPALWAEIDTLVDGRFDARAPDRERRFIGSTNQSFVHRTSRYADLALWTGERAIEVRIDARGRITVVGDPTGARGLARELRRDP